MEGGKGKGNDVIIVSKNKSWKTKKIVLVTFACDVCGTPVLRQDNLFVSILPPCGIRGKTQASNKSFHLLSRLAGPQKRIFR